MSTLAHLIGAAAAFLLSFYLFDNFRVVPMSVTGYIAFAIGLFLIVGALDALVREVRAITGGGAD